MNVKVDGIKGDLDGLTKRVDQNTKDINVAGTIALENRKFIGDNKVAIENNTKNININAKAIDELKGQVGKSSTVINDIKLKSLISTVR